MLIIYTDGSSLGNPGNGGWAAIIKDSNQNIIKELSGGFKYTTNNRMELYSIIESLKYARQHNENEIKIFTDSQLVCNGINKGWLKNWIKNNWKKNDGKKVLNIDLWTQLNELLQNLNVSFHWIEGHSGIVDNERCDTLCKQAAQIAVLEDVNYTSNNQNSNLTKKYISSCGKYTLYINNNNLKIYNNNNNNDDLIEFNIN